MITAVLVAVATFASAEVRGPEGDRGFRNVYPAADSGETDRLYRDDLRLLAREAGQLEAADGGTLTPDHRTYLDTRRRLLDRRYAEATGHRTN